MIVVDTSAVVSALLARPPDQALVDRLGGEADLHAPHLVDVEMIGVLRRLVSTRKLSEDQAADARADFADLTLIRYPHWPLAGRMWELRHNLSSHDAAFVVLAEALGVPLVTTDGRLARVPGHAARVEVYGAGG